MEVLQTCKSCGHSFEGTYCNRCGEKIVLPSDRSFRAFLNSIWIAVTFSDSRFLRSLRWVIVRPGFLSLEVTEGRTVRYLRPVSLFFFLNLFYFLFPVIQLFNATLDTQLGSFYGHFIKGAVVDKVMALGVSLDGFEVIYNNQTKSLAKLLVMVFVLLSSLPLNLLYGRHSRYFNDHVTYTLELACFNLFINTLMLTLAIRLFHLGPYFNELHLSVLFVATNLYFLIRSSHTFYRERQGKLILKSLAMLAFLKIALECYRFILFYVTIALL